MEAFKKPINYCAAFIVVMASEEPADVIADLQSRLSKIWFPVLVTALVISLLGLSALQCHRLSEIRKQVARSGGFSMRVNGKSTHVNLEFPEELQNGARFDWNKDMSPPPYYNDSIYSGGGGGESPVAEREQQSV